MKPLHVIQAGFASTPSKQLFSVSFAEMAGLYKLVIAQFRQVAVIEPRVHRTKGPSDP
jgi:hypothetical protein